MREAPKATQHLRRLTVVIPTLNEAEAIGKVLDEILEVGIPRENILVVDGGSTDDTVEIARSKGVRVVFQEGKGKADAIRTAVKYVKTPYTLVMDGDYTYPAKHIPHLLEKALEDYDLVIGWRRWQPGTQPLVYRVGNRLLTKIFNLLFGTKLHDVLSGMYLVKTRVLRELLYESRGFGIEAEIVAHVASTTGKVAEVPIEYRRRLGKKKLGVGHGLHILTDMLRLAWRYNPTFMIFLSSALLILPGLVLGAWAAYEYLVLHAYHPVRMLAAIVLLLFGFESLLLAILTLYIKRMEYRILRLLRAIAACEGEET